eukprot:SAG31_NODE_5241_length_2656_cov_1.481424_2_plen_72_part_00
MFICACLFLANWCLDAVANARKKAEHLDRATKILASFQTAEDARNKCGCRRTNPWDAQDRKSVAFELFGVI